MNFIDSDLRHQLLFLVLLPEGGMKFICEVSVYLGCLIFTKLGRQRSLFLLQLEIVKLPYREFSRANKRKTVAAASVAEARGQELWLGGK